MESLIERLEMTVRSREFPEAVVTVDILKTLESYDVLEQLADRIIDKYTPQALKIAEELIRLNPDYSPGFTPKQFMSHFMGYAVEKVFGIKHMPKTADEMAVMSDIPDFVRALATEIRYEQERSFDNQQQLPH